MTTSVVGPLKTGRLGDLLRTMGNVRGLDLGMLPIVVGLALIWAYFQSQSPYFLTARNLTNLLLQISVIGTVAAGQVFVLLIGEVDLSVGSLVGLSSAIIGVLIVRMGLPWWLAVLLAMALTSAVGALQGSWSAYFGVPTFVVTLAGLLGWLGVQLHVLGNLGTINVMTPEILALTTTNLPKPLGWGLAAIIVATQAAIAIRRRRQRESLGLVAAPWGSLLVRLGATAAASVAAVGILNGWKGIPTAALIMLGLMAGLAWMVQRTRFGRNIMAVGGNAEAARRAGINVNLTRVYVLTLCALLASVGGLLSVSRQAAASTQTGGGTLLLEAIAAAVIGGTSLFGGRGSVWSALVGAMVMGSLSNGLDLTGQPADVKYIIYMCVLLLAVTVDSMSRRTAARSGAR
jgi:D-xylose transport system permease protein